MQAAANSGSSSGVTSWKTAKEISKSFGYTPASFSIAIRTLTADQYTKGAVLQAVTKFQVARILRTPSFKSMLYYASCELHPERMEDLERVTIGEMMDFYEPLDIAALIVSFLLYRKLRRLLDPNDWAEIEQQVTQSIQIGALVGKAIPKIGVAPALLVTALRTLSAGLLIPKDATRAKRYLIDAFEKGMNWDVDTETEYWGCSTVEIATMVISTFGFGVDVSQAFAIGNDISADPENMEIGIPYQFKMAWLWVDCALKGADQPMQKVPGDYYPLEDARRSLDEKIAAVRSGSEKCWLGVGKEDISPERTPKLFSSEQMDENCEFEVPDELKDVFSLDQITSMEEDEFDNLIDQMDEENAASSKNADDVLSAEEISELEDLVG